MLQKKPSTPSHHPPSGKIRKNTPPINFLIESSPKELDERYSYLQKFGKLKKSIDNGNIIFSELLQIPGVWICYRHPKQRQASIEKLQLESLELEHVPLLEGEEKLKVLSLQHNKIKKIENLVSLPNLLYLDLLDNKIEIIENIDNLHNLRILLMPQNAVCEIKSLQIFSKLEVLDLHSNKIRKLQSFKSLKSLKILNLADNLIENIEGLEDLISLEELNLKMNQIQNCKKLKYLNNLQKLFLCENKILSVVGLEGLTKLEELSLDGNEICSQMDNYVTEIFQQFQSLKILDHKEKSSFFINEENNNINKNNFNENFEENEKFDENENFNKNENFVKNENNNEKKLKKVPPEKNEKKLGRNQILEIIKELWEKELEKIKKATMIESLNKTNCKSTIINEKETFVLDSGHAEIDSDTSLFIYGNAFKVVLLDEKHHRKIKKILFKYVFFDHLMQAKTFEALTQFQNLEEITFSDNYITSLLQISKLEVLQNLKILEITENPISQTTILQDFIIYRFPKIERINEIELTCSETDPSRKKARLLFENFDKILQLPEKTPKAVFWSKKLGEVKKKSKTGALKQVNRLVNEASEKFLSGILFETHEEKRLEYEFEKHWSSYLDKLIKQN